ncbi:MAG: hypothetical protein AB7G25_02955 [Sphingomonadaceae bacterium]
MDNDLLDLADRLRVVAGMIMEDNNPLAVSTTSDPMALTAKLSELALAADDMASLIAAAKVLLRLG